MQTTYIKFLTEEDRVNGFYELIRNARVTSFPGKLYQVPRESLKILEDLNIGYRQATDEEVKTASGFRLIESKLFDLGLRNIPNG